MDKITELLTRGVANIYPSKDALEKILLSGKKLRIYHGIDPTGKLHLGHMSVLRKLRQFQNLDHEIIILIGDFTARIGDPTNKLAARKRLSKEQVKENATSYKELVGKILDLNKANIRFLHNEKWTNKLKPEDMLELASYFTVSQLLERDMFQQRIKENREIYVHEFLYPVFQAYDSVTMDVDMEIGGNDQTFNMLAGRTLMKKLKNKEKFILTTRLLTDPTGKKMGKTEDNIVALDENSNEMFGKIMSWPDEIIILGFTLLTDISIDEIDGIAQKLESGTNPIEFKKRLAFEIVQELNNEGNAKNAQEHFEKTVQRKELPEDIPTFEMKPSEHLVITDLLVRAGLTNSKSDAKRLVEQGAVEVDSDVVDSPSEEIIPEDNMLIKCGRRNFLRIKLSNP